MGLVVWDTPSNSVSAVRTDAAANSGFFGHPTLNRILAGATSYGIGPFLLIRALDSMTGATLAAKDASLGQRLTMSPDGSRLYDTLTATSINPSGGGHVYIYDPSTLEKTGSVDACNAGACFPSMTVDAPGRDRVYVLDTAKLYAFNRTTGAGFDS